MRALLGGVVTTPVPVLAYSEQGGRWVVNNEEGTGLGSELSLVTLNTWFEPVHEALRTEALLSLLSDGDADVICLQEVTPRLLAALQESEWVRDEALLATTSSVYGGYGCAILSRTPIHCAWELELHSMMARSLLVVELGELAIATVHLESTRALAATRVTQLEAVFHALRRFEHSVLTGDFNFDPSDPEQNALDPVCVDAWSALRDEPGYTEDTTRNTMRFKHKGREKHVRYDRILVRSGLWRPTQVDLFADEAIGEDVFISDHFGVEARLTH